jgi:glycosyltransferase involved in cell wall biosynthesis
MVSFRARFSAGLEARGVQVVHDPGLPTIDSLLVIGGTRDIPGLWRAKQRGVRIVQRLNGMNWLHHLQPTGIKHYLRAEYGNLILRTIRTRLADHVVYQSNFAQVWWERTYGSTRVPTSVIYNAVDLNTYTPESDPENQATPSYELPIDHFRLLLVEGSLMGGYELGLKCAVQLIELLNANYQGRLGKPAKLLVAGRISDEIKNQWTQKAKSALDWAGLVAPEQIPALDRSAHLLYSSDINAACPNSVIEALACGLPVLAFDTGALPELVTGNAGRVVPYGGDPWQLEQPDIPALAEAAVAILSEQSRFRTAARQLAEESFDLDQMADSYLDALIG